MRPRLDSQGGTLTDAAGQLKDVLFHARVPPFSSAGRSERRWLHPSSERSGGTTEVIDEIIAVTWLPRSMGRAALGFSQARSRM
jgi:hypothetical protein